MKDQRPKTRKKFDAIVFAYSEGSSSSEIQKALGIPEPSYWRIVRDGGGMPFWAKIDFLKKKMDYLKKHEKSR